MKRLRRFFCFLSLVSFMAIGGTAHADTYYFTLDVPSLSTTGTGYLTTIVDPTQPNALDIINISGTFDGQTIAGLMPCATYDATNPCGQVGVSFNYDNLLYPNGGFAPGWITTLDYLGIGFELQDGTLVDIAADGSHTYDLSFAVHHGGQPTLNAGFDVTLTPEPSSFLMLATGLLGITVTLRRRIAS